MDFVIEECLVVEVLPIDPGVALADHLTIDLSIADPDATNCTAVAVGV